MTGVVTGLVTGLVRRRARFTRLRLVAVLTMLVVLTSAMGTTLALTRPPLSSAESGLAARPALADPAGATAVEVASRAAGLSLSFDHHTLGPGLRAATATMSGPFARAFADSFRRELVPEIRRGHASGRATVRASGLVRADRGRAVVLVLVDQLRRDDSTGAAGRLTSWRLAVELVWSERDAGGEWRVDDIRAV